MFIGLLVSHAPPGALDRAGERLIGRGVAPALFFSRLGVFSTYAPLCATLLVFALVRRAWLSRVLLSIAALLVAWLFSDAGKLFFMRPRMEHWIAIRETSYSYASGHAALSLVFYGLWLHFLLSETQTRAARRSLTAFVVVVLLGIGWSRAALGAHYVTDILGGYMLGGALLCAAAAVYRPIRACA